MQLDQGDMLTLLKIMIRCNPQNSTTHLPHKRAFTIMQIDTLIDIQDISPATLVLRYIICILEMRRPAVEPVACKKQVSRWAGASPIQAAATFRVRKCARAHTSTLFWLLFSQTYLCTRIHPFITLTVEYISANKRCG